MKKRNSFDPIFLNVNFFGMILEKLENVLIFIKIKNLHHELRKLS
jgi:hypothetical protein